MENRLTLTAIRIKQMRLEHNWTQKDLANRLGLKNDTAIANYEAGYSTPKDDVKLKLCEIFNCSVDYLMGKSEIKNVKELEKTILDKYNLSNTEWKGIKPNIDELKNLSDTEKENLSKILYQYSSMKNKVDFNILSQLCDDLTEEQKENIINAFNFCQKEINKSYERYNFTKPKFYMCPVYGQISAGQPNWAEECIEGRIPVPMTGEISNPEECFYLKVNGESMNKVVKNGAYALIHKQDIVEDGEIAVVLVNGYDATLKKFSRQGDFVILEPMSNITDNPDIKTQIYDSKIQIKILGKYIGKFELNK